MSAYCVLATMLIIPQVLPPFKTHYNRYFQSVCPLMEKNKRLMEASWWERLTEGKTGSCSERQSQAQYIFNPIFCWWVGLCSLSIIYLGSNYKENWALKNECFLTVVLEKTLDNPLDCKEIQPVHPKGNQSWIFIGRTDAEAETPVLWPRDVKNWLICKDPNAGKDWGQEEKGMTEDELVR